MSPKVSVLMSVYNGIPYLSEAIESILNQTLRTFEFIIIDDCSTDNTWEVLNKYADKDRRIRLLKNESNIGLTKSLNKGLKLAHGEYIARQDADDVSLRERLEKQTTLLDKQLDVVLASCLFEDINSEGQHIRLWQRAGDPNSVAWHLLFYNYISGHGQVMFRRNLVLDLGGYYENRRYSQDYELWCRLLKIGNIVILPEVLMQRRVHDCRVSVQKSSEQLSYSLSNSKHNLTQLIGEELSLEEVIDLRKFWIGHLPWGHFPEVQQAGALHSRLKQIYQAFLLPSEQQNFARSEVSKQLRILIAQQFLRWGQTLNNPRDLFLKFKISFYIFRWYPLEILNLWLKKFWKLAQLIFAALAQLHNQKTSQVIQ